MSRKNNNYLSFNFTSCGLTCFLGGGTPPWRTAPVAWSWKLFLMNIQRLAARWSRTGSRPHNVFTSWQLFLTGQQQRENYKVFWRWCSFSPRDLIITTSRNLFVGKRTKRFHCRRIFTASLHPARRQRRILGARRVEEKKKKGLRQTVARLFPGDYGGLRVFTWSVCVCVVCIFTGTHTHTNIYTYIYIYIYRYIYVYIHTFIYT